MILPNLFRQGKQLIAYFIRFKYQGGGYINQMKPQTYTQAYQDESIKFIRKIAGCFQKQGQYQHDSDSLGLSESEDSLSLGYIVNDNNERRKPKWGKDYVSPYHKDHLSINRIAKSTKRPINSNQLLEVIAISPPHKKKVSKKVSSEARYRQSPSKIEKQTAKAAERIKTEARMIYEIQQKQIKNGMTKRKNQQKWADFLLRERRFQEERKSKTMKNIQEQLCKSPIRKATPPRPGPGLTVEDYIRKMKRDKAKLQEKVLSFAPNSLRWKSHKSIDQTSQAKRIRLAEPRQARFLINM